MVSLPDPPLMMFDPGSAGEPFNRLGTTEANTCRSLPPDSARLPPSGMLPSVPKPGGGTCSCGVLVVSADGIRLTVGTTSCAVVPVTLVGSRIEATAEDTISTASIIEGMLELTGAVLEASLPKMMSLPPLAL